MKNKNLSILGILSIVLILIFAFYFSFFPVQKKEVKEFSSKETVYVQTVFGCLPLKDKYTPAEWDAWQDLQSKVFGYKLRRCD